VRRGRSTTAPTKAEAARITACKEGPCVACAIWSETVSRFPVYPGGDYHHLLSGGIRRGHMFGMCLCPWHHRGQPDWAMTPAEMRECYGPSLAEGSKPFHAVFGSDDALLAKQDELLKEVA
jgi:hypothetical protein